MSYQERRAIVSLISTILIAGIYCAIMIQSYPQGDPYSAAIFRFWGAFILILIPVTIVSKILIYIVFSIFHTVATGEDETVINDERDRFIELKATRNSLYVFSVGIVLAMTSLVIELPPATLFIILICAGVVSEMISEISQFYFYRSG